MGILSQRPRRLPAFLAAGLFTALALCAFGLNAEWLASLDVSVETWFETRRSPRWQPDAAMIFRFVGQPAYVAFAAAVCGGLLSLQARSTVPAALVIGAVALGVLIEQALKAVVGRSSTAVAELQDKSLLAYQHTFPSGHVTGSVALLGTIAVCLGAGRSRAVRAALASLVIGGVLLVAYVTLYTKAHTFSDVIGGIILGGALVASSAALLDISQVRRTPEPRTQT